jgi:uncharacterized protein (DUF2062 family)
MKERKNNLFLNVIISLGIAAVMFCIAGVVIDINQKGSFSLDNYRFTKMAVGALVVGLGFGLPTYVYGKENIPLALRTLVHMGIGCVVMTITAFTVGWIPTGKGATAVAATIAGEIAVAFIVWLFFYSHQKSTAKKMNKKISEINRK